MKFLFKPSRRNPSRSVGAIVKRGIFDGVGLFGVSAVADNVVIPALHPMLSGLPEMGQKAVDAGLTAGVAVIGSHLGGMIYPDLGDGILEGGLAYAGAKAVSIPVPQLSIGAKTPTSLATLLGSNAPAGQITPGGGVSASAANSQQLLGAANSGSQATGVGASGPAVFSDYGGRLAPNQNTSL